MRRPAAVLALVGVAAAASGVSSGGAPPAGIRAGVERLVRAGVPGAVLFVRQGDRTYSVAAGFANTSSHVRMRTGDTFRVGSITKSYVAAVVLELVAAGKLRLGDPVSRYLPGLVPGGRRITIRELLSHTSGIYDYTSDPAFRALVAADFHRRWSPRRLVRIAVAHPPLFPPGSRYSYSSTNYVLLGLVVERVSGETAGRELRTRIFRPLALAHTAFPTGAGPAPEAHGYLSLLPPSLQDVTGIDPSVAWTAGAVVATGADVAAFYRGLLTGRLLRPAQLREMEAVTAQSGRRYGLGLERTRTRCGTGWGHDGNFPGYLVLALSSADGRRQAILLVNVDPTALPRAAAAELEPLLVGAFCGDRGR